MTKIEPAPSHIRPSAHLAFLAVIALVAVTSPLPAAERSGAAPSRETDGSRYSFDLRADEAEPALKRFSEQSGRQVLFPTESVRGVRTNDVKGEFTAREALVRMLAGTPLSAKLNERTGAWAILRGENGEKNAASRPSTSEGKVEGAAVTMQEVEVTGSRIRSLLGEQTIQPVLTLTRADIERYGVSSLGEVLRYIPQVSSYEAGQPIQSALSVGPPNFSVTSNRVTATLRGAPQGGTLLLINGRRAPKNGQAGTAASGGEEGYDLGGIPLSAVERVDVLLDGASAVYGADAVGGVINVILKKNYRGSEVRLGYENTFDTDVSVRTVSISHGFAAGRLSGLLTASFEKANSMMWTDRPFLKSFDRRPLGGTDLRSTADYVASLSGNLPGLSVSQVAIPPGSNGVSVAIADYAAAGAPTLLDFGQYLPYNTPYERRSLAGSVEFEIAPWLTAFLDGRWGEMRSEMAITPILASNLIVPAGAPGNPFGVPIRAVKYFHDLPYPERHLFTENRGFTLGARGPLLNEWRYEVSAGQVRSRPDLEADGATINAARAATAYASTTPPNLLYGSQRTSPNPAGTIESLLLGTTGGERSETWTYDAHADGPLFALPAGELRGSAGAEYREEYVDFPVVSNNVSLRSKNRYTSGYYLELRAPLLDAEQNIPLVNRLEASFALRHDRYSDFAASTNPRYGLLWRPLRWIMLRGSVGEGYKVPTLVQLYRPAVNGSTSFPPGLFLDPLRGNEAILAPLSIVFRGNPDLRPEKSENVTAGLVVEIPTVRGLSVSWDYFDTEYLDRVGSLALPDRLLLFPATVLRGANRPTDPAGWPGPVIGYEDVAFNISVNRISGYDLGVKYSRPTPWGEFNLNAGASNTTRYEIRSAPHLPPTTGSTTTTVPLQFTGSAFWSRGAIGAGALCSYRDKSFGTTTSPPGIPSAIRWDVQASYDFGRSPWAQRKHGTWWGRALADTRLGLTIFNVLDRRPPLRSITYMPDNTTVDSRLRRYALSLSRKF